MAIVNLTPDSFYAPSRVPIEPSSSLRPSPESSSPTCPGISLAAEAAVSRIDSFFRAGASIVDLGAVSTRPGAAPVSARTEWRRLAPVLRALAAITEIPGQAGNDVSSVMPDALGHLSGLRISIDTTRASIVRKAYKVIGPFIVNDISAGEDDPEMLPTVAELGLPFIAMHKRGNPQTMNGLCDYPNGVMAELIRYFGEFAERAERLGIRDWILDPGLGFAKTAAQCWEILENLEELKVFGRPILIGSADKRFTKEVPQHILASFCHKSCQNRPSSLRADSFSPQSCQIGLGGEETDRIGPNSCLIGHDGKEVWPDGTAIADAVAVAHGADILRVHRIP